MNICLFIQNISHKGGTERMAVSLANELFRRGHTVHVVSLEAAEFSFFPLDRGARIHSIGIQPVKLKWHYFKAIKRLRSILKSTQADIVIDVDVILSMVSLSATSLLKTKVIAWEHYNFFTKTESKVRVWARKRAAKRAYAIVTLTNEDVGFYRDSCKCNAKVLAIPNFVESLPNKTATLDNPVVLAIGHLIHLKGFDMLIKAWKLLKEEGPEGWKLHIVGEGEEKNALTQLIANMQLDDEVLFFPPTENIEKYYLLSSIYAMTSRIEGLPMVLIEAKANGLPIVSFACRTGPSEIIRDGVDGYLVAQDDILSLKEKLLCLMQNKELRLEMGKKAREDAGRFLNTQVMDSWDKLLNSVE